MGVPPLSRKGRALGIVTGSKQTRRQLNFFSDKKLQWLLLPENLHKLRYTSVYPE